MKKNIKIIITELINAPFIFLSYFFKRKYYVFCSKHGFTDNAKYLFIYYVQKGERCVWVDRNRNCDSQIKDLIDERKNIMVIPSNSIRLLYIVMRAKVVFITHSFYDLGFWIKKNACVVNLFHGVVLKKMGFDSPSDINKFSLTEHNNPYEINDFVLSSSKKTKLYMQSCMRIDNSKILPLGQPRIDFLNENRNNFKLINELKAIYNAENKKVFIYAPTFRDSVANPYEDIYSKIINSFERCSTENQILILRLHPNEHTIIETLKLPSRVVFSVIEDSQMELLISDVLITDFSGIVFDYALLNKPIGIYAPDFDHYSKQRGGLNFNMDDMYSSCVKLLSTSDINDFWVSDYGNVEHQNMQALQCLGASKVIYDRFK